MRMWKWVLFIGMLWLLAASWVNWVQAQEDAERGEVVVLTVEGAVTPAMGSYLERGLAEAESSGAALLILRLDTPGGQVGVMGQLVRQLSNASLPTLVYVWPSGGQAASAGTFITLSADLAAMTPQTTIGAASVVGGMGEDIDETMSKKVTNDLVAAIRSQTERRGEKATEWAEQAITDAIAANAEDALEIGIIDFIARDLDELLEQVDGTTVELADGNEVTVELKNASLREIEMNPLELFLHIITNPNIALLLVSLGTTALIYEFYSPGGYVGGIIGVIALTLGWYALGSLDANWAGLGLIAFGFILFAIETQTPTHGLFAAGGLAAFIFGSILLFQTSYQPVSLELIIAISLSVAGFMVFALAAIARTRYSPALTGQQGLIGSLGQTRTSLNRESGGMVFLNGELWKAHSPVPVPKGQRIRVVAVDGLHLEVEPVNEQAILS
ncbi:MAG: NfeD family protein [Ardenticatenaceae bacterium]